MPKSCNWVGSEKDQDQAFFCNTVSTCADKLWIPERKWQWKKTGRHQLQEQALIGIFAFSPWAGSPWHFYNAQSFQPHVHIDTEKAANIWHLICQGQEEPVCACSEGELWGKATSQGLQSLSDHHGRKSAMCLQSLQLSRNPPSRTRSFRQRLGTKQPDMGFNTRDL